METQKLIVVSDAHDGLPESRIEVDTGIPAHMLDRREESLDWIRRKFTETYREVLNEHVWAFFTFECPTCYAQERDGVMVHYRDCPNRESQHWDIIDFITGDGSVSSLEDGLDPGDTPKSVARRIVRSGWEVSGIDPSDEERAIEAVRELVEDVFDQENVSY